MAKYRSNTRQEEAQNHLSSNCIKMNNVTIKKASIKDGNYLSVEYTEFKPDGVSKFSQDCKIPVHQDLKMAFAVLDDHLENLSFQRDKKGKIETDAISCKGFTIGGSGESEGVTLTGIRTLESDKILNISSPFQRFDGDFYEYKQTEELIEALDTCKSEVLAYLFEGKHEEDNQMSIPFEELEEANA